MVDANWLNFRLNIDAYQLNSCFKDFFSSCFLTICGTKNMAPMNHHIGHYILEINYWKEINWINEHCSLKQWRMGWGIQQGILQKNLLLWSNHKKEGGGQLTKKKKIFFFFSFFLNITNLSKTSRTVNRISFHSHQFISRDS